MTMLEVRTHTDPAQQSAQLCDEFERIAAQIRQRAYQLFAYRGSRPGHELDDWLTAEREVCRPDAELVEYDDHYVVKFALPGFPAQALEVSATREEIVVRGGHEERAVAPADDDGGRVRWSEFHGSEVFRRVRLPETVNVEAISASFDDGLLQVKAPKMAQVEATEEARPIAISAQG